MKKQISILVAGALLVAGTAYAGYPEFDAVGDDSKNFFALKDAALYGGVLTNAPTSAVNVDSDFTTKVIEKIYFPNGQPAKETMAEYFKSDAGQVSTDACWGFDSHVNGTWNEGRWHWSIVLQGKPESDLNINIYDCVLAMGAQSPWTGQAAQTSRYRMPWGTMMFDLLANPQITVTAESGPYNTNKPFSFTMDARTLPGLQTVALKNILYTSKGMWSEGVVAVMPETGKTNASGQSTYYLHAGDRIIVDVYSPATSNYMSYGQDSVTVKYLGMYGIWAYASKYPSVN